MVNDGVAAKAADQDGQGEEKARVVQRKKEAEGCKGARAVTPE